MTITIRVLGTAALLIVPQLAIAQTAPVAPRFPPPEPKYQVVIERSVPIPMRDGVRLSTDLYRPVGLAGRLPVILMRTPYGKQRFRRKESLAVYRWTGPHEFAGQGYVVAVQDVRGRYESDGLFVLNGNTESEDGFDAIEWLGKQSWSSGKVGTYGCSYLGENQIQAARLRSSHHAAMIAQAAGGAYRFGAFLMGGAVELSTGFGWFWNNGTKIFAKPPTAWPAAVWAEYSDRFTLTPTPPRPDYQRAWSTLPLIGMVTRAGGMPSDFDDFVSHEPGDPWWDRFGYAKPTDRFDVPAIHVNSWYDLGVKDTQELFNLFRTNALSPRSGQNQILIVSPTSHCGSEFVTAPTIVGELDLGDAQLDYWGIYLRWFDHWLKGADNGATSIPKVQLYVMGKNQWRAEQEWPLSRAKSVEYFLDSDGRANSRHGTGRLVLNKPGQGPPDRYTYDPATPVPSVGGPVCCTGTADAPEGAFDQSTVEIRADVLVYTTPPLVAGVEVTGPVSLVLYVSSDARDTDFTGKLVDVHPSGRAYNVQEGILRARYRDGFDRKVWMEPGKVYQVRVDLQTTSHWFAPGHQIRLEVSSSNFPRFDRNLNTGGRNYDESKWVVARNAVRHTRQYPSRLVLPVVPEDNR
jgi:putative CocE/NonD family hydrolase